MPAGFYNGAIGCVRGVAIWAKSKQHPGTYAVCPDYGAAIFWAVVDDFGQLVRVAP